MNVQILSINNFTLSYLRNLTLLKWRCKNNLGLWTTNKSPSQENGQNECHSNISSVAHHPPPHSLSPILTTQRHSQDPVSNPCIVNAILYDKIQCIQECRWPWGWLSGEVTCANSSWRDLGEYCHLLIGEIYATNSYSTLRLMLIRADLCVDQNILSALCSYFFICL